MPDADDSALLREFAGHNSETAFAEVVRRHIGMVYSVALRFTGSADDAQDVTQVVFTLLARKAAGLSGRLVLTGWLYETTRFTATRLVRSQTRRRTHEQEAAMQSTFDQASQDDLWHQLAPHLEAAMSRLGERDRTLLALRFYENKTGAEAATLLGIREDAARKRTNRALEKLRRFFFRHGVSSTAAVIAETIAANSVPAAPVGLAQAVAATAMAKSALLGTSTLTLSKGTLKIMAWTKAKTAIVAGLATLLVAGTTAITVKENRENRTYAWQVPQADKSVFFKTPATIKIVPTIFSKDGGYFRYTTIGAMGIAQPLKEIILIAYQQDPLHTIVATELPTNRYDFLAKLIGPVEWHKDEDLLGLPPNREWTAELQKEIAKKFGVTGRSKMRATDVLALKPVITGAHGFEVSRSTSTVPAKEYHYVGIYSSHGKPVGDLVNWLQLYFQIPIINQTGLTQTYDFSLVCDPHEFRHPDPRHPNLDVLKQALAGQLGLELVATNMPIEMFVVEKVE